MPAFASVPRFESMARATKLSTGPIAALSALAFFANVTPASAATYEYCRRDVGGHMLSCSLESLQQCQWMSSGIGGDCLRDPFLPAANPFAYAPSVLRMNTKGYRAQTPNNQK